MKPMQLLPGAGACEWFSLYMVYRVPPIRTIPIQMVYSSALEAALLSFVTLAIVKTDAVHTWRWHLCESDLKVRAMNVGSSYFEGCF